MKKILFSLFVLSAFVFYTSQVLAVTVDEGFSEESTTVDNDVSSEDSSTEDFTEENTTVEGDVSSEDSTGDEFGEETTTVEGDTSTETTSSSRRGGSRRTSSNSSVGEVLGAATEEAGSCTQINSFLRIGLQNNVEDVKTLQTFLNKNLGISLPVTGFFGPLTDKAVRDFQTKYATEILKPWVDAGLTTEIASTGYVYKTTLYTINKMLCPEISTSAPVLN